MYLVYGVMTPQNLVQRSYHIKKPVQFWHDDSSAQNQFLWRTSCCESLFYVSAASFQWDTASLVGCQYSAQDWSLAESTHRLIGQISIDFNASERQFQNQKLSDLCDLVSICLNICLNHVVPYCSRQVLDWHGLTFSPDLSSAATRSVTGIQPAPACENGTKWHCVYKMLKLLHLTYRIQKLKAEDRRKTQNVNNIQ